MANILNPKVVEEATSEVLRTLPINGFIEKPKLKEILKKIIKKQVIQKIEVVRCSHRA